MAKGARRVNVLFIFVEKKHFKLSVFFSFFGQNFSGLKSAEIFASGGQKFMIFGETRKFQTT